MYQLFSSAVVYLRALFLFPIQSSLLLLLLFLNWKELRVTCVFHPTWAVWSLGEGQPPEELDKPIDTPPLSTLLIEKPQSATVAVGEWLQVNRGRGRLLNQVGSRVTRLKSVFFNLCQRWRHHLHCKGGGQRSPPQAHCQVVQRQMDGSGEQDGKAPAAEGDLRAANQGAEPNPTTSTCPTAALLTRVPLLKGPHLWNAHHQSQRKLRGELQMRGHVQGQVWQLLLWLGSERLATWQGRKTVCAQPNLHWDDRLCVVLQKPEGHRILTFDLRSKEGNKRNVTKQRLNKSKAAKVNMCVSGFFFSYIVDEFQCMKNILGVKCNTMVVMMSFTFFQGNCKSATCNSRLAL